MRIEIAEHAFDGIFQKGLVIHWFDIGSLDTVQYLGKGAQLLQRQRGFGTGTGTWRRGLLHGLLGPCAALHAQQDGQGERGWAGETAQVQHVELQL